MTFDEWWAQGGRDYLMFHPNVKQYARKAWDMATEQERQAHRDTIKTCLAQEKTIQRLTKGA